MFVRLNKKKLRKEPLTKEIGNATESLAHLLHIHTLPAVCTFVPQEGVVGVMIVYKIERFTFVLFEATHPLEYVRSDGNGLCSPSGGWCQFGAPQAIER